MLLARLSRRWFCVKFFCILFLVATRTSENDLIKECASEIQDDITWPRTLENKCSPSEPICLNKNQEISKRCCLEEQIWETNPVCESFQQIIENPCPESSIRKDNICIFVFNSTYPPKCPYEENLNFEEYINYIENDLLPIWLPVEKENSVYGEGLFYWKEKSENYMTLFDRPFDYEPGKSCLLYHENFSVKIAECSEIHTAICAYDIITNRNKTFCSQIFGSSCKQSDYSTSSKCFCNSYQIETISNKVELLLPFQNLLFQHLDEVCYIGLEKQYDTYIWTKSNASINYTYWSRDANFGEIYLQGAITSDGWILASNEEDKNCTIIEKDPPVVDDEINLAYNTTNSVFTVTVQNPSLWKQEKTSNFPLIFCFTDASKQEIIKKLDTRNNNLDSVVSISFSASEDGPGNYWCEGFLYPTLKIKRSKIYFIRPLFEEFVAPVSHIFSNETNPLSEDYLKYTAQLLEENLQQSLPGTPLYPRIFGILDLDLASRTSSLNFHFTTKTYIPMYTTHMSLISVQLKDFSISNVLTFSTCIGGRTTNSDGTQITWTTTEYGSTLFKPNEGWCITQDGSAVTRTCEGNFIYGASWSDLGEPNCSLDWYNISPTLILRQTLSAEQPQMYLPLIIEQVERVSEMQYSDVELVAQYLHLLALQDEDIDIPELSQLINAVMKIPETDLQYSQYKFKSTDKILSSFIKNLEKTEYVGTIVQECLFITSFKIDNFYSNSIILRKNNDTYEVDFYNVTDDAFSILEVETGLTFNSEIMDNITDITNDDSRIIIVAYFQSSLFNEYFTRDYESIIFSIIFRNINLSYKPDFDNLITIIYNTDFNSNAYSCSYWQEGLWVHKSTNGTDNFKTLCSFQNTINIGLVSTTNVTSLLEELQSDTSCHDSISRTIHYLRIYLALFQPIDVSLVYQILDRCKEEESMSRHMNLVNKLLDLPVHIIQTARTKYDANILKTFEEILLSRNIEYPLTEYKNFVVLIHDLSQSNLTGLYISCGSHKCSVETMHDYRNIPKDSELMVILDQHLLDQLITNQIQRIIITLFANDAFFLTRAEYDEKSFSKVIGVSIPSLSDGLGGNISVTYKLHSEVAEKLCECWDEYGQEWDKSNPGESLVDDDYRCTFWKTSYYVLSFKAINVTKLLEELLNSEESNVYILEGIQNITSEYKEKLRALDLSLIGTYFESLEDVDDFDEHSMNVSVQIINNLMHVARYIVQQAESDYFAASQIMWFFKKRLKQVKTTKSFCGSRIFAVVSFLNETNISGIEIYNSENFCEFGLTEKGSTNSNNTSGITLNEGITDQISNSNIIIIAFYNDLFFYDGSVNNNKNNTITFGVLLPQYTDYSLNDQISVFFNNVTNNLDTVTCVSWELYDSKNIADGSWDLPRKLSENYTCNYFRDGWYTLLTQDQQLNVTVMLKDIKDESVRRKLNQLEAVTSFYENFSSYDVYLMLKILIGCKNLKNDSKTLLVLKRIMINYSKIPKEVKKNSQINYETHTIMLNFIKKLAKLVGPNGIYNIDNYLQISACSLVDSSSIFVLDEKINCKCLEDENYRVSLDYSPYVPVNPEVLTLTVFKDNELFVADKEYNTADIIHVSLNSTCSQLSSFTVTFNQNKIQKTNYSCACGVDFGTISNGTWIYFKTIRRDLETICDIPDLVTCSYVSLVNLSVDEILIDIFRSEIENKLSLLADVIGYLQDQLQISQIETVYDILNNCEIENAEDLQNLAAIVDVLMDLDRNILASARGNFTEELHNCIERLIKQFKGEIRILEFVNFAIVIESDIYGIIFEESNNSMYTIKKILTDDSDTEYSSDIALIISKYFDEEYSKVYITVYFNDALFIGRMNSASKKYGVIIGLDFLDDNLEEYMKIYFANYPNETNVCAYWNHQLIDKNVETWYWDTVNQNLCENRKDIHFFAVLKTYNVTSNLQDILLSNSSIEDQLEEVIDIIIDNSNELKPLDIHLIAAILGKMLNCSNITQQHINLTSSIVSCLYLVNVQVLTMSQQIYSATDNILYTIDEVIKQCQDTIAEPLVYNNFTVIKADVKSGNITGLKLEECGNTTCKVSFLVNQTRTDVISMENLNILITFSDELRQQIITNDDPVNLIVTVHFFENFFTESSIRILDTSKILGIVLDGLNNQIEGPIFVTYMVNNIEQYENSSCSYWNYQVDIAKGFWQYDSDAINTVDNYLTCQYEHLTHFVLLLASSSSGFDYLNSSHILDIITNINSILSLLGLFGILLTAVLFDRWRNNTGNQILINFTVAVSIKNVMLYISEGVFTENKTSMGCTITGGILHYSILSEFCWMLIIAILQFKRFVEVLGGPLKYVLLKACICGWAFPSLPVFLIIIIDVNNYNASKVGLCYPSGFGLYLGVWLPLLVIISINFVIFVFILYNVFHKKTEYREQVNHEIIFQWRLAILLFSMLGLTWAFGFLALLYTTSFFAVVFCFMATLQGFIMFLFFIVFNKNTRYMYIQGFSWWMYSKGYKGRLH